MHGLEGWRRYAVYWTPAPGPLAAVGAAWLGWDAEAGAEAAQPDVPGLPEPLAAVTAAPRAYGLHATIKPPFRLAEGTGPAALDEALAALAARLAPVVLPGLAIAAIGPWQTLLPEGDEAGLNALAAEVVAGLDAFRAPPSAAEIARRNPDALTARQRALLDRWGYPHVMEEFRFHITLSGPHGGGAPPAAIIAAAAAHVGPHLPRPFVLDALSLCGEGGDGRFRVLRRHRLGEARGAA